MSLGESMKSKVVGLAAAVLTFFGVLVATAAPASADNGDGTPGCSHGEICLWFNSGDKWQKQFWYNSDHGGIQFWVWDGRRYYQDNDPSKKLQDNALEATNRDTSCMVYVGDLANGFWSWKGVHNDNSRTYLGAVNNKNDRHQRCGV